MQSKLKIRKRNNIKNIFKHFLCKSIYKLPVVKMKHHHASPFHELLTTMVAHSHFIGCQMISILFSTLKILSIKLFPVKCERLF